LFVEHLGIQLAVRRFRHKARKSTANVHQTHNQRALMNGKREFTAPRRLIGESTDPPEKGRYLNNSRGRRQVEHPANVIGLSDLPSVGAGGFGDPSDHHWVRAANPTPDRDNPQCRGAILPPSLATLKPKPKDDEEHWPR
jgi:hypothetical protein